MKIILIIVAVVLLASAVFGIYALNNSEKTGDLIDANLEKMTIQVNIPCSGHASLIRGYLLKAGVSEVRFRAQNLFDVYYNPTEISREQIMNINIFKEYPAKIVN